MRRDWKIYELVARAVPARAEFRAVVRVEGLRFSGKSLEVAAPDCYAFEISSIEIGGREQLVGSLRGTTLSAANFDHSPCDHCQRAHPMASLDFDPAAPGEEIVIRGRNAASEVADFVAKVAGVEEEKDYLTPRSSS